MPDFDIISADSHVIEPPDLWEKWPYSSRERLWERSRV